MRIVDCVQGSDEWREVRLGVPTASQFSRIVTPKTLKVSSSAEGYLDELLAEWAIGEPCDGFDSAFVERGREMEPEAVAFYEADQEVDTTAVGFVFDDSGDLGCSPDRLVGTEGGLEIKCPSAKVHMGYFRRREVPEKYMMQIQGSMLVTGRAWWDFLSYNPVIPSVVIRVARDDEYIAALAKGLAEFLDALEAAREALVVRGCVGWREQRDAAIAAATARNAALEAQIFGES